MSQKTCDKSTTCQSCNSAGTCSAEEKERHAQQQIENTFKNIRRSFMVLSGKGGVGKSSVSVNLAATLAAQGSSVGILDADIHGPNIPKMLGVDDRRPTAAMGPVDGILPIEAGGRLRVMSIGFFLNKEEDAIIWRGPMKHGLMKQFLGEVRWGSLDYLIIDLPPGTGDEALSIAHLIKRIDGALIVTTPQDVALLDSKKSISFCRELKIPRIGVIENMSGMLCPHCGKEINLFKVGGGEKIAKKMKVPFLGRVPLDPAMVLCTDEGKPFVVAHPDSPATEAFRTIARQWVALLDHDGTKSSKN